MIFNLIKKQSKQTKPRQVADWNKEVEDAGEAELRVVVY